MNGDYDNLSQALDTDEARRLIAMTDDIGLVEYNGADISASLSFGLWLESNGISCDKVKNIVLVGRDIIALRDNRRLLLDAFSNAEVNFVLKDVSELEAGDIETNHILRVNFAHHVDLPQTQTDFFQLTYEKFVSTLSADRFLYAINVVETCHDKEAAPQLVSVCLSDFDDIVFKKDTQACEPTAFCKGKQKYISNFKDTARSEAAFHECMAEVKHGCSACNQCSDYGGAHLCPLFQHEIANFYREGNFVPESQVIAHSWDMKAAAQGYQPAALAVAADYGSARGCEENVEKAIELLSRYAISNNKESLELLLGLFRDKLPDDNRIVPWLLRKANSGSGEAADDLYHIFSEGSYQMPQDDRQFLKWATRSAENGNANARMQLIYKLCDKHEWAEALKWCDRIREDEGPSEKIDNLVGDVRKNILRDKNLSPMELAILGINYTEGYGVGKDEDMAKAAFGLAIERGYYNAYFLMAVHLLHDEDTKDGKGKKFQYIETAAEHGDAASLYMMSVYLRDKNNVKIYDEARGESYLLQAISTWLGLSGPVDALSSYQMAIVLLTTSNMIGEEYIPLVVESVKSMAELNFAPAQHLMSELLHEGKYVDKNENEAFRWEEKAAQQGYEKVNKILLADQYYKRIRYKEAAAWYEKAAEENNAHAYSRLGDIYFFGRLGQADKQRGNEYYLRAAELGDAYAQYVMGAHYYFGTGVEKNMNASYKWSKAAVDNGYADALFRLAYLCTDGLGTERDGGKALEYYQQSIDKGYSVAAAENNIGCLYADGNGVEKDEEKAAEWYLKAAEHGDDMGQKNIAWMYHKGSGVEKDDKKALCWMEKAADQGQEYALMELGDWYHNGDGVDENLEKAFCFYKKAAELGNAYAQYRVGACFEQGEGVAQDRDSAVYWYRKAVAKGNWSAREALRRLNVDWDESFQDKEE